MKKGGLIVGIIMASMGIALFISGGYQVQYISLYEIQLPQKTYWPVVIQFFAGGLYLFFAILCIKRSIDND